ncbi:hypothetical protein BDF14DRAFT_553220 [Spinellus fusiger]|nr:hypothetical protein BDF14DRAFT_553220 [Spinellus fusiger]
MVKKTFIDRKTAKHFHVVHRSQRDPLINDTDASELVLQEVVPGNIKKVSLKKNHASDLFLIFMP